MTIIRTGRGKFVGTLNEQTGIFSIKDGKKMTHIKVPADGLTIYYTPGDGITEKVFIPSTKFNATIA